MKRRRYLAALTATPLAGCLDGIGSAATQPSSDGVQRRVHLESVADAGADHDVSIDAAVTEPSVTDEHPARVAVTTTNGGQERDISVGTDGCCLFNRSKGASDPAGLWLHLTGAADAIDRAGDRWERDAPADERRAYPAYACLSRTYGAGESLTNEYHVWDDYRVDGYLEPGVYRFAADVSISRPGDDPPDEDDRLAEFTWGFDLRVERP